MSDKDHAWMNKKPALVITVDTEADNEWEVGNKPSYENIKALISFQELCESYNAKPTYLVTYDVAVQNECAEILREISKGERAEIGAHLHPWSTPPLHKQLSSNGRPYLYEYPRDVQRAKLDYLTNTLRHVFGSRPLAYRAGRWGLHPLDLRLLEEMGYTVDTSVLPFAISSDSPEFFNRIGSPSFCQAPKEVYHPDRDNLWIGGGSSILEVPVTTGIIGPMKGLIEGLGGIKGPIGGYFLRGLRKVRLANIVRLQPVHYTLSSMLLLLEMLFRHSVSIFNISLHSSEWVAGKSPSILDQVSERKLRQRMKSLLEYLKPRTQSMTLSEFASEWVKSQAANKYSACHRERGQGVLEQRGPSLRSPCERR